MPPRGLKDFPLPPRWTWALVGFIHGAALVLWGPTELLHDAADYIAQGRLLAAWAGGDSAAPASEVLGRFALHNPGYAAIVALAEAFSGRGELIIRLLQCLAGIGSGFILYAALHARVGKHLALAASCVLWFHPSMLFFRLSLWPVAFATLGTTLVAFWVLQGEDPRDGDPAGRFRSPFGWTLALLPFFAAPALLLLPGVWFVVGRHRFTALAAPSLALWLPWTLALSLALGTFVPVDLSSSRNLVLGNHPAISEDRGSLWGDPEAKAGYLADLTAACPQSDGVTRKRCAHRFNTALAKKTAAGDPSAALRRAVLRAKETWVPGSFLPRALKERGLRSSPQVETLLALLHWPLMLFAILGLRSRSGRTALAAAALWTLPVLVAVGFTRLRQPALPFLLVAASFGIHSLARAFPRPSAIIRGLWPPTRTTERTAAPETTSPKPAEIAGNPSPKRSTSSASDCP
jgi:hypothetical protein